MNTSDGYRPIDLGAACNVPAAFARADLPPVFDDPSRNAPPASASPAIGPQLFHGLPFAIALDPERCFIGIEGKGADPAHQVAIGGLAPGKSSWRP